MDHIPWNGLHFPPLHHGVTALLWILGLGKWISGTLSRKTLPISEGGHCSPSHLMKHLPLLPQNCALSPWYWNPRSGHEYFPEPLTSASLCLTMPLRLQWESLSPALASPWSSLVFEILKGALRVQSSDGKREHTDSLWQKCYFLTFSSSWRGFISILSRSQNGLCKSRIQPLSKQEWRLEHLAGIWERSPIWNKTWGAGAHRLSTYRTAYFFCG